MKRHECNIDFVKEKGLVLKLKFWILVLRYFTSVIYYIQNVVENTSHLDW